MPDWADALFRQIAVPRPVGAAAVTAVEEEIASRLRAFGYDAAWQEFTVGPGRLAALSHAMRLAALHAIVTGAILWETSDRWTGAVVWVAGLAAITAVSEWWARRPPSSPAWPARNLVATRSPSPRAWLVAHSDTKAQTVSLQGRIVGVAWLVVGEAALGACVVGAGSGSVPRAAVAAAVAIVVVAAWRLGGPPLRGESAGAVDNASGIVAALVAAEASADRDDVGVLITGAEELGMMGARAWVAGGPPGRYFVNFDGLDDHGPFNIMVHGGPDSRRVRAALAAALAPNAVRRAPLPLGVFVDGGVLGAAGMAGVTVSAGTWETLRVIHTEADQPERTGAGRAVAAGAAAARAMGAILG